MSYPDEQLSETWLLQYADRKQKLIQSNTNPWDDKLSNKSGLTDIYLISAVTETLNVRAELNSSVKLNDPNPQYEQLLKLLRKYLECKTDRSVPFIPLVNWIESYLGRKCKIVRWTNKPIPDPRCLLTVDDCLSYFVTKDAL